MVGRKHVGFIKKVGNGPETLSVLVRRNSYHQPKIKWSSLRATIIRNRQLFIGADVPISILWLLERRALLDI